MSQEEQLQFEVLYQETYSDVLRYIICHCQNIEDVNDILQDTYLEFYKVKQKRKIEKDKLCAFLKGIAKYRIKKYYGKLYKIRTCSLFSKNKQGVEQIDIVKENFDLLDFLVHRDLYEEIWQYIKMKKTVIVQIFFLYYESEYTIKEISNELGISESNVKNLLYRTRRELQEVFGKEK